MASTQTICCFMACLFSVAALHTQETRDPLVTTSLGKIRGTVIETAFGKPIYSFRGIRYAKAPVGELRFQPPVPVDRWEGIYNATEDGPLCPQPTRYPISEDCLILNVYTTKLPNDGQNPKRPVIVYIHPGGFYGSTSVSYLAGPQYFMDQDIVLVPFNYRVGSLGFISTGGREAPGNNGLKDQVEVLRWINQNIAFFGGDPDSVTILGYSAGGWSVVLHMVSPMSRGLFHKAVAMSGSALGISPIVGGQPQLARKQAKFVGCPENDTLPNIVQCLKTVPYTDLANSLGKFREFGTDPVLIWSPVIEPNFGQQRFLTDHPIRLIVDGKLKLVPFITGRTKDEFSYFALNILRNETLREEMDRHFERVAPISFTYERATNFSQSVSKSIRSIYFQDKPINNDSAQALKNLYEDANKGFQAHRTIKLIAQHNSKSSYYYDFTYQGRYSHVYKRGTNNTIPYGVVHHDDLIYLFYISKLFPRFTQRDPEFQMVKKLTTLFANFARTGNPTPHSSNILNNVKWDPYNLSDRKYLEINTDLVMKEKLLEERLDKWENMFPLSRYLKN